MFSTLFAILLLHSSVYIGIAGFYVTRARVNWGGVVLARSGRRHILWLHKFRK